MKRIVLIILVLIILYILGLIILRKLEDNDNNKKSIEQFSSGDLPTTSAITISEMELDVPGGNVTLYNVENLFEKFYEISSSDLEDCKNNKSCKVDTDCSANQECADLLNDGESKCYSFIDKPSCELESARESYILINNTDTKNFTFDFGFVLKNVDISKVIISTKSNLWKLINQEKNLYLIINDLDGTNVDKIKLSNSDLECYKFYKVKITTTEKKITINFNEQSSSNEAFFKLKSCSSDFDCVNSSCSLKKCVFSTDEYYIGKLNEHYYDMFIGDINLNSTTLTGSPDASQCIFSGKEFSNKRVCVETCKSENCSESYCDDECKDVPMCEFETIGRHSIDCIQECIKNKDCNSDFCMEKCEKCEPNCPWNKDNTDDFDSQYFDEDGKPSPLKLTLNTISTDGTKVSVRWRTPFEGKAPIVGYMSYLYKTFNKSEGVKINKINLNNCNKNTCEYILKDLSPNETYTLGLKSYNNIGLSRTSNLLTFKASITNINMDLRIETDVNENDIGDFNYCNVP